MLQACRACSSWPHSSSWSPAGTTAPRRRLRSARRRARRTSAAGPRHAAEPVAGARRADRRRRSRRCRRPGDRLGVAHAARHAGVAVLYPTRTSGVFWQLNRAQGSSDVDNVSALLDHVLGGGCFDPRALTVTGVSNGAGFAQRLAARCPDASRSSHRWRPATRRSDPCPATSARRSSTSTEPPTRSCPTTAFRQSGPGRCRATRRAGPNATAAAPSRGQRLAAVGAAPGLQRLCAWAARRGAAADRHDTRLAGLDGRPQPAQPVAPQRDARTAVVRAPRRGGPLTRARARRPHRPSRGPRDRRLGALHRALPPADADPHARAPRRSRRPGRGAGGGRRLGWPPAWAHSDSPAPWWAVSADLAFPLQPTERAGRWRGDHVLAERVDVSVGPRAHVLS